jgi:hypothetical protein
VRKVYCRQYRRRDGKTNLGRTEDRTYAELGGGVPLVVEKRTGAGSHRRILRGGGDSLIHHLLLEVVTGAEGARVKTCGSSAVRGVGLGSASSPGRSVRTSRREWLPLVDVEFVALGVLHCYPVVIDALLAQDADDGGTEIR